MQHVEEAGIHSGDSACAIPPPSLPDAVIRELKESTYALARELHVCGLMNIQYAVKDGQVFVLEVNPRASRTVPFVSKAIGVPLAKIAMKVMLGVSLKELGALKERLLGYTAVKEAVFPFNRFPGVDTILGPEMKSTGEVMGLDRNFGMAFAKAQAGAGGVLPRKGQVFLSVRDADKAALPPIAATLTALGFTLCATRGTAQSLDMAGIAVRVVNKVLEGRPHVVDHLQNGDIALVINTVGDKQSQIDSYSLRRTALEVRIPYYTTIAGARAAVTAIEALQREGLGVTALQDYHQNNGRMHEGS
jgi:carbamoyl-phosphate synthase large subunit